MANSEHQIFTFNWRIDNWRMLSKDASIESPSFVVDFLENTEWILTIRRFALCYFMEVGLERADQSEYTQDITIAYSFEVHSTYRRKNFKTEMISKKFGPGNYTVVKTDFKYEKELLLNDTLTVRCRMSRGVEEVKTKDVVFRGVKGEYWNSRVPHEKYECSVRSQVPVSSKYFVWPIHRIAELPDDVKLSTSLPSVTESQIFSDFSLYLKEDPEEGKIICIEIHINNNEIILPFQAYCRIRTVGAPRNIQFREQGTISFSGGPEDYNWPFPCFLKMKDLAESYLDHTNGTLYLQFDLSFSTSDCVHTEVSERFPLDVEQRDISHACTNVGRQLYRDREYADATLHVGDREVQEFKVHKLILATRSMFFRRNYMNNDYGIIGFGDLDPDTMERLLKYMYTEEVEDLNLEDTMKLYYGAVKFNLGNLQDRLRPRIIANLSFSNVCETLALADAHNDQDLWESIVDYIDMNANEIFGSYMWKYFAVSHSSLAARSMIQVFTRKSFLLSEDDSWGRWVQQRKNFMAWALSNPRMSEMILDRLLSLVVLSIIFYIFYMSFCFVDFLFTFTPNT